MVRGMGCALRWFNDGLVHRKLIVIIIVIVDTELNGWPLSHYQQMLNFCTVMSIGELFMRLPVHELSTLYSTFIAESLLDIGTNYCRSPDDHRQLAKFWLKRRQKCWLSPIGPVKFRSDHLCRKAAPLINWSHSARGEGNRKCIGCWLNRRRKWRKCIFLYCVQQRNSTKPHALCCSGGFRKLPIDYFMITGHQRSHDNGDSIDLPINLIIICYLFICLSHSFFVGLFQKWWTHHETVDGSVQSQKR